MIESIKWYEGPNGFVSHVANAYEVDGKIKLQMCHADGNIFTFWPPRDGKIVPMGTHTSRLVEFVIDPSAVDLELGPPQILIGTDNDFPRIDDRLQTHSHSYTFGLICDKKNTVTDWKAIYAKVGGRGPRRLVYETFKLM